MLYSQKEIKGFCFLCSKEFVKNSFNQKFCSHSCAEKYKSSLYPKKGPQEIKCSFCGKLFRQNVHNQKYCCKICAEKHYTLIYGEKKNYGKIECIFCGELFRKKTKGHVYCSRSCRGKHRTKNRVTHSDWMIMKEYILERDNFECVICGKNTDLHIHHIVPIADGGTGLDYNLQTLCAECHIKAHLELNKISLRG